MGKLIFFYVNHGNSPEPIKWHKNVKSLNPYVELIKTEGYYQLIKELRDQKIVDVLLIIESNRSPGYFEHDGIKGYVVPHIRCADEFIEPGDIIWGRGGFRSWHDYLIELQARGHWLMLYAANTGRERWPFWDIVLDDLNPEERFDPRGRLHVHFKKPMNQSIFYPRAVEKKYDICIGASHIHDRKGQYKTLDALLRLKNETGKTLKCVMPGSSRGGVNTRPWLNHQALDKLNIHAPGMLNRHELAEIYNESKLFCYLGGSGQGDRGPMEAMACGTPLFIGPTGRHAPSVYNNPEVTYTCENYDNPIEVGKQLIWWLDHMDKKIGLKSYIHYLSQNSIQVAVDFMKGLIDFMLENPKQNKEALKEYARTRKATIA